MRPNFNSGLDLKGGGDRVDAWGPCNWHMDPQARRVRIDEVTVSQDGVTAASSASDERQRGQRDWGTIELRTPDGEQLHAGQAEASGWWEVVEPPEKRDHWTQTVTLKGSGANGS